MAVSPARVVAYEILLRVEREDSYATELLHSSQYQKLSTADHGLATELVMGVLRWRSFIDARIAEHSSQKIDKLDREVLTALRLAAYQLMFLDRVPQHAAVHESVELVKRARKRSAVPFANAVLRKLNGTERPGIAIEQATSAAAELAEASAHPPWMVTRWVAAFGLEAAKKICGHDQQPPVTAVRVLDPAIDNSLQVEGIKLAPGYLLASARRVLSGDITHASAYRAGQVFIQDEASQLVALLVGHGANILDCCAAPGGKTRVMAQRNPGTMVIAAELHPRRAQLVRELVREKNVRVIGANTRNLPFNSLFDRVLVDVPCSGSGTLARNPEIKWRLKLEDLTDLQGRQVAILQAAMQHSAPGGRLVYSTCSLEREENEDVVEKALAGDPSFQLASCREELEHLRGEGELSGVDTDSLMSGRYLRTIPGVHPCDGFFAAILQRKTAI
jgi:16S rRNA (cytosine967-C5)-methyltransferase